MNDELTVINACSLLYVRVVHIQGESSRETEAWFDLLSRAMEVGIFSHVCLHIWLTYLFYAAPCRINWICYPAEL